MGAAEHLAMYAEGWTKGDAAAILRATAEEYTLDDPNAGLISRNALSSYLSGLKETAASLSSGKFPDPFMKLSEVVTQEAEGTLTAWCWWHIPGTPLRGGGLIKVTAAGVRSEVLTYYSKCAG